MLAKNCKLGAKCKGSCISRSKSCLPELPPEQKTRVTTAVKALQKQQVYGKISSFAKLLDRLQISEAKAKSITESTKVSPELLGHVTDFNRLTGKSIRIKEIKLSPERSYADMGTGLIVIDSRKPASGYRLAVFHEMGHFLERSNPKLMAQSKDFVQKKATGPKQLLSKLTKDPRYGTEQAFPGKFVYPYVGKTYLSGSTEVVSVGMEHFISPLAMSKLYKADPEHFNLIVKMLEVPGY